MTTIAEKLTTIKNALTAIKNSIISKGQTPTGDITTYASAILNIEGGGVTINNQDKTITENGNYIADEGYTGLGTVTVNVEGGSSNFVGIPREVTSDGVFGFPIENFTFTLPSNAKDLSSCALYYAFYMCTSLTSVDLSNLSTISGDYALRSAFDSCTSLTSVDLSSLSTISGFLALSSAFDSCTSLTSVDLSNLSTISSNKALDYAFYKCTNLKELSFPALTSESFGSYTTQFNYMLANVTGCTVHFPSNLESVIGSWSDVKSGFGGTNTTVLFDLPATE